MAFHLSFVWANRESIGVERLPTRRTDSQVLRLEWW